MLSSAPTILTHYIQTEETWQNSLLRLHKFRTKRVTSNGNTVLPDHMVIESCIFITADHSKG